MSTMSKKINKPIPNSKLHKVDDPMLEILVSLYRGRIKIAEAKRKKHVIKKYARKIQRIYKIFGYRSAFDCLRKDGD